LVKDVPSLGPMRDMVRLGYHFRRGEHEKVVFLGEALLERTPPRSVIGWGPTYATIAMSLIELGQHQRALDLTDLALAAISEADRAYFIMYGLLEVARTSALFMLGRRAEAESAFDSLEAQLDAANEMSAIVLVIEARSRVCKLSGDRQGYLEALDKLRRAAVRSGQPSVVMFADRIAGSRTRFTHGSVPPVSAAVLAQDQTPEPAPNEATAITHFLLGVSDRKTRHHQALRLLAEACDGNEGYLFEVGGKRPQLLASLQERKPAERLLDSVATAVAARPKSPSMMLQLPDPEGDEPHTLILLTDERGNARVVAFAAVVRTLTGAAKHVQGSVLRDVARILIESTDAASTRKAQDDDKSDLATIRVGR
jgi:hypothetical protein